jgi:hypothetical protein
VVNLKTQTLKLFNHGKQEHLGQDPEHFNHCTYCHRHYLWGVILHEFGAVKQRKQGSLSGGPAFML